MPIRRRGGSGGGSSYGLGPPTNIFADDTARDTYASANAAWLTQYNDNRGFWIRVGADLQRRNAAGDAWEDVTPVVEGPGGSDGSQGRFDIAIHTNAAAAPTPSTPIGGTYNLTTGVLTPPAGATEAPTTPSTGEEVYISQAVINPKTQTGTVTPVWSAWVELSHLSSGLTSVATSARISGDGTSGSALDIANHAIDFNQLAGTLQQKIINHDPGAADALKMVAVDDAGNHYELSTLKDYLLAVIAGTPTDTQVIKYDAATGTFVFADDLVGAGGGAGGGADGVVESGEFNAGATELVLTLDTGDTVTIVVPASLRASGTSTGEEGNSRGALLATYTVGSGQFVAEATYTPLSTPSISVDVADGSILTDAQGVLSYNRALADDRLLGFWLIAKLDGVEVDRVPFPLNFTPRTWGYERSDLYLDGTGTVRGYLAVSPTDPTPSFTLQGTGAVVPSGVTVEIYEMVSGRASGQTVDDINALIQAALAAAVTGNTEMGIAVTHNSDGTFDFVVSGSTPVGQTESIYYGVIDDPANAGTVDVSTLTTEDAAVAGHTVTIGPSVDGSYFIFLVPANHDLLTLVNTSLNVDVLSTYTKAENVRMLGTPEEQYHSYALGPSNAGLSINYRLTLQE